MAASSEDVVLHQLPRLYPKVPNASPPCMKLETFLRMAKIPYKVDSEFKRSSKGKMPWIEHKSRAVADSGFCVEYLSKAFGVDLDRDLTAEQKAIATPFRVMIEENTYWTVAHYRWCTDYATTHWRDLLLHRYPVLVRQLLFWGIQRTINNQLWSHGIGRHSVEEIYGLAERDLRAISTFLGSKIFLFGDKPCSTDAAVFGLVANFIWAMPGSPQEKVINQQMPNLIEFSKRMMDLYFPDMEELYSGKENSTRTQSAETRELKQPPSAHAQ